MEHRVLCPMRFARTCGDVVLRFFVSISPAAFPPGNIARSSIRILFAVFEAFFDAILM